MKGEEIDETKLDNDKIRMAFVSAKRITSQLQHYIALL